MFVEELSIKIRLGPGNYFSCESSSCPVYKTMILPEPASWDFREAYRNNSMWDPGKDTGLHAWKG